MLELQTVASRKRFAVKDVVEEELEKVQGRRIGSNVSRVFNVLSRNADVSSVGV